MVWKKSNEVLKCKILDLQTTGVKLGDVVVFRYISVFKRSNSFLLIL